MRVLRSAFLAVTAAFLASVVPHQQARATEIGGAHPFGLGVAIGYPAGISGKYYVGGRKNAIEGMIGSWANSWNHTWYMHGVYMWHPSVLTDQPGFELPWHIGIGGFVSDHYRGWNNYWGDDLAVGVRTQIGLDFDLKDVRLQFSGDIGLNVGVVPDIFWTVHPSVTVRYFF